MSLRRFVYLVTDDANHRQFLLRRLDMSRFFFPKHETDRLLADPPPLEEGRLPRPAMKFVPPLSNDFSTGHMHFMLVPGVDAGDGVISHGRTDDKVAAANQTGRNLLYDCKHHTVRILRSLTAPKLSPISLTVGGSLYILDTILHGDRGHCFDAIVHDDPSSITDVGEWLRNVTTVREEWYCESLPPPPYADDHDNRMYGDPAHVTSYAVAPGGAGIWVSKPGLGTHSLDTARRACAKAGDWALPFHGRAHHAPEHGLWFGLSCCYGEDDAYVRASDLAAARAGGVEQQVALPRAPWPLQVLPCQVLPDHWT